MLKVKCTVYLGEEELFVAEGDGQLDAAAKAAEMVREDYAALSVFMLDKLSWKFEQIYPKKELFVPPSQDDNFVAYAEDLQKVRDRPSDIRNVSRQV